MSKCQGIKAIDKTSIHRITSGQVVVDLQTAVKELLENSIDAGSTNVGEIYVFVTRNMRPKRSMIEIRFKNYGLASIEVIDNGSGIPEDDYDSIGAFSTRKKRVSLSNSTQSPQAPHIQA